MPAWIADVQGSIADVFLGATHSTLEDHGLKCNFHKGLVEQGTWEGQKLCLTDVTAELDLQVELFSSSSATYSVQWILSYYS